MNLRALRYIQRRGLTKVEWLVIFTCGGIMMGLLIPAVESHPRRQNQCATQVCNLAKAAIQYEMTHGHFPGYLNDLGSYVGNTDPSDENASVASYRTGDKKLGSWVVPLLPYLDSQPTYEIWTEERYPLLMSKDGVTTFIQNAAPNLALLQCPNSVTLDSELGRNSYIANTGMHHLSVSGQPILIDRVNDIDEATTAFAVSFADSMQATNGVMNQQYERATNIAEYPVGPKVTMDDFKDGLGNSVLFSESLQAVPWHQLDPDPIESVRLLQPSIPGEQVAYPEFSRFTQGMIWLYEDPEGAGNAPTTPPHRRQVINSTPNKQDIFILRMNQANAVESARPSSAHAEGCNFGFADGATRFISETIDYRLYQALLTPRGKNSLVPDPTYVAPNDAL
jgi:prepilin-type processing-associated H-X9-DG protein